MKQNKKQKQTLESAQYGLEISFKMLSVSDSRSPQEKFSKQIIEMSEVGLACLVYWQF